MTCAWEAYLDLLPVWMRSDVDKLGASQLREIRLRVGCAVELALKDQFIYLERIASRQDIQFVINTATRFSPWSVDTIRNGYVTARGGHRVGICGDATSDDGKMTGIRTANMVCIRVARDIHGNSFGINPCDCSILIIGRPGCGKTTLLRDLVRQRSSHGNGSVGVVDERCELFPISQGEHCFDPGQNTDVISGVDKKHGIEILLRCMNPDVIAVDEITSKQDCEAVVEAGWCGVHLFATAHAGSREELYRRPIYRPLINLGLFDLLVTMQPDMRWTVERMTAACYA